MKTFKETGGPAFARPHSNDTHRGEEGCFAQDGMTLRDYFAAKAMQSILSFVWAEETHPRFGKMTTLELTQEAYLMADAMLEVRKA